GCGGDVSGGGFPRRFGRTAGRGRDPGGRRCGHRLEHRPPGRAVRACAGRDGPSDRRVPRRPVASRAVRRPRGTTVRLAPALRPDPLNLRRLDPSVRRRQEAMLALLFVGLAVAVIPDRWLTWAGVT